MDTKTSAQLLCWRGSKVKPESVKMTEKNQMQHHHRYFEELSDIHDKEVLQMLPERNSLKRQVNKQNSKQTSASRPNFIACKWNSKGAYKVIRCGEPVLMHNSIARDDDRILFTQLMIIFWYLNASTTIFSNSTFKMVPTLISYLLCIM